MSDKIILSVLACIFFILGLPGFLGFSSISIILLILSVGIFLTVFLDKK